MNVIFVKRFFLMFMFITTTVSYAQEVITKNVADLANLPDDEFYDVLHDTHGNYWFCADSGLYRFDGISFIHYSNTKQRSQSLFNLKEDDFGRIWCNSLNGQFFVVDPAKDRLDFFVDVKDELIGKLPVYELYKDQLIVKVDNNRILQYDFNTKEKTILVNGIGPHSNILRIDSKLFYFNLYVLNYVDHTTQKKHIFNTSFKGTIPKLYKVGKEVFIICSDENKNLEHLYVLRNDTLIQIELPANFNLSVYDVYKNKQGLLFFATDKGVKVMEEVDQKLQYHFSLLQNSKVSRIIEDTAGNYIFTTLHRGIYYWDGQENFIYQSSNFDLEINDLNHIQKFQNNEFLVTDFNNSIYKFKYDTQFKYMQKWNSKDRINNVFTFDDRAFITIAGKTFFQLKDQKTHHYPDLKLSSIKDMDFSNGKLFLADSYGLNLIKNLVMQPTKTLIRQKRCLSVKIFNNNVYAAFADGIFKIVDEDYIPIIFNKNTLYADQLITGNRFLWAIKKNQGIFYGSNTVFRQLTSLKDQNAIVKKSNDRIYILEDKKLYQINEEKPSLDLLKDISSHIKNIKILDFEIIHDVCLLTTDKGLLQISILKDSFKDISTTTFIDQILVNEITKNNDELQALSYHENSVKLFLKNTNLAGRNAYTFRYKMNDNSKRWQYISDIKNPIYLSYLSPASYKLIYQTLQNTTVIHEDSIHFNIFQPYWKTWWFFSIIFITALAIIFIIVRLYLSKLKAKQHFELEQLDLKKNLAEAKLQNLTSQMNPHFTFNALNTVQGLILDDKKEDAYTYLAHFSNLFRKSIDFSSKTFNTFEEEITFLETYLKIESKRFNNQLNYQIDDTELEDRFFKIPAMILQPFVENAIKHGLLHKKGAKQLRIQFALHKESIECIIIDNGIGRKTSRLLSQNRKNAHLNMATSSVQKRFDLYKKYHNMEMSYQYNDLAASNGESLGTKVTITIPLMK